MSALASKLDTPLTLTSNNLADAIRWLKDDAYVVVHAVNGRFFHVCKGDEMSKEQIQEFLNTHRIIYIDVSRHKGLLDDGEWNYYIKEAGFNECICSLKGRVNNPNDIPHKTHLKLGY